MLTPATSYGYRVIWFAAVVLREPLDPWQQWAVIHLGELLEDGTGREPLALRDGRIVFADTGRLWRPRR